MGNLTFMSFNRAVSDDKFTEMLSGVINDHYGKYYQVVVEKYDDGSGWIVQPKDGILEELEESKWVFSLFIFRATDFRKSPVGGPYMACKGKFSHKHMHADHWGYWFTDQIHGHMSAKYGMKSSDEGVSGTWKIDPTECLTAKDKMLKCYAYYRGNPEFLQKILEKIPRRLLEIQG